MDDKDAEKKNLESLKTDFKKEESKTTKPEASDTLNKDKNKP